MSGMMLFGSFVQLTLYAIHPLCNSLPTARAVAVAIGTMRT